MHYELKVQYAWEYISKRYSRHYADRCIFGHDVQRHASENLDMLPTEIAKRAMKLYGGQQHLDI